MCTLNGNIRLNETGRGWCSNGKDTSVTRPFPAITRTRLFAYFTSEAAEAVVVGSVAIWMTFDIGSCEKQTQLIPPVTYKSVSHVKGYDD